MTKLDISQVEKIFTGQFTGKPEFIVRAPGRVNLIGEHTDYNDGFVLPMAINRAIWIAFRKRNDREVHCYASAYDELLKISLDDLEKGPHGWREYLKGVAWKLEVEGHKLQGWDGVLCGDIPIGAGLSSSAAIEMACLRTFSESSDFPWEPIPMAKLAQLSEIEWVGLDSGIMDQMISALGQQGYALLIDCKSLKHELIPLPEEAVFIIFDTGVSRTLVGSEYNLRQAQCYEVARICGVPSLRELNMKRLEENRSSMDTTLFRRAVHVLTENDRTLRAAQALRSGEIQDFGKLMNASHESLRDNYEVSSAELDALVEIAQEEGAYGARMTGAGFGGCVVILVQQEGIDHYVRSVLHTYHMKTQLVAQAYQCTASEGVRIVKM